MPRRPQANDPAALTMHQRTIRKSGQRESGVTVGLPTDGRRARFIRWVVAAAMSLTPMTIVGCGNDSSDALHDGTLHEAVGVEDEYVDLKLFGLAVNHEPESYKPTVAWTPVGDVMPEGSEIEEGDALFTIDPVVPQERSTHFQKEIDQEKVKHDLARLETEQQLGELDDERREYELNLAVLEARIEATRVRDESEIEIARLKVKAAMNNFEQSKLGLQRIQTLARRGVAAGRQVEKARDEFELARQGMREPEGELDYLLNVTYATTRRLLQIERDELLVALGAGGEESTSGVFGQIEALRRKAAFQAASSSGRTLSLTREQKRDLMVLEDSAIRAESDGVLRHRERGVRRGDRLRMSSAVYVLRDEDMGFTFALPLRWRDLVTTADVNDPAAGRVFVDVPQLGVERAPGRVSGISALPYQSEIGRVYRCYVRLEQPLGELREGMQVDCSLPVKLPAKAVAIAAWAVGDPCQPIVTMADGSRRPITGRLIGHRFIVFEGLQAGEHVKAMPATEPSHRVRFEGLVEPVETRHLQVPWRVEIVDMVDDGSFVEKGQVVATLARTRNDPNEDPLEDAVLLRIESASRMEIARIEAEAELAKTYVAWRKAALAVEEAQLESLVARYVSYEGEAVAADVKMHKAQIAYGEAERKLADLTDEAAGLTVSEHQVRNGRLWRDRTYAGLNQAKLQSVAAIRTRDWLEVWEKQAEAYDARHAAEAARHAYSLQREMFSLAMNKATEAYESAADRARELIDRVESETVRAPFAGHVYYNFDDWGRRKSGRALKTGRRLRTTRPFHMPLDRRRRVSIEVPARYYQQFQDGAVIEVHASVLGEQPVQGRISRVSRHFHVSEMAADEQFARGMTGAPPMVFTLKITLELTDEQLKIVKPGVTASVEIEP